MKKEVNITKALKTIGLCFSLSIFVALLGLVPSAAVAGVIAPAECPCNYFLVPQVTECWVDPYTPPKLPTFSSNIPPPHDQAATCQILISDSVEPFETIQLQITETTSGNKICQINISNLPPECGPQEVFVQGLTVEQYLGCVCELQAYATDLSIVPGIQLSGGPPYICFTFDCMTPPLPTPTPPAVTFPCTDPDCQSQQSCENLGICSGDGSTPCFWNGTECLNPLPPPSPMPMPTPTPTPPDGGFQPGDANGDGEINILDVTALLNHILIISSAPGNGDCNEDGAVNILDVTCVLNIILGI